MRTREVSDSATSARAELVIHDLDAMRRHAGRIA